MTRKPDELASAVENNAGGKALPPLDQWNPGLLGDMDLLITRDGSWLFEGKPIGREAIVRLFSTILRKEQDGAYYLVTPVEKWRIAVEDTPLLAHSAEATGEGDSQVISVTTNMGETLEIGPDHPLEVGAYPDSDEPRPVVAVRHGVEARLVTNAFYQLAEFVEEQTVNGETVLGVFSHGKFWKIGQGG